MEKYNTPDWIQELLDQKGINAKVDRLNLDEDWERQPYIFQRYSDAVNWMNKQVKEYYAELDYKFRQTFLDTNGKIPSETRVEKAIECDKKFIEMNYVLVALQNAVKMMEHRKKALEGEGQLFFSGYFSVPNSKKLITKSSFNYNISKGLEDKIDKKDKEEIVYNQRQQLNRR